MPFFTDESKMAPDVTYTLTVGTVELVKLQGAREYADAMRRWEETTPERLEGFEITREPQLYQLEPGKCTGTWACDFIAPMPPGARARGLLGEGRAEVGRCKLNTTG